jgi:hypothetical protein
MAQREISPHAFDGWKFSVLGPESSAEFIRANSARIRTFADVAISLAISEAFAKNGKPDARKAMRIAAEMVHKDKSPEYYGESLADPNIAVERHELRAALFASQQLVVIHDASGDLVALNLSANTSSGRLQSTKLRMHPGLPIPVIGHRRYAWQRLELVRPDMFGSGLAQIVGDISLHRRHPKQRATAYTWPQLMPAAAHALVAAGLEAGDSEAAAFDMADKTNYEFVRYAGVIDTVRATMRAQLPGLDETLYSIWAHVDYTPDALLAA